MANKLREAMTAEMKSVRLGGQDTIVDIQDGCFKPANHKENRVDHCLRRNQNGTDKFVAQG